MKKTARFECLLRAVYTMNWPLFAILLVVANDGGSTCGQLAMVCDVWAVQAIQSMLFLYLFRVPHARTETITHFVVM